MGFPMSDGPKTSAQKQERIVEMNDPPTRASSSQLATGEWENEGGTVHPHTPTTLPDGIVAVTSVNYLVGPYRYSRLEDALAEHGRRAGDRPVDHGPT